MFNGHGVESKLNFTWFDFVGFLFKLQRFMFIIGVNVPRKQRDVDQEPISCFYVITMT